MPLAFDIRIDQGETWECEIPVFNAAGNPLSLSGWDAIGQIRPMPGSPLLYHEWTTGNGLLIGESSITLIVPASVSALWTWRSGVYDVELIDPDGAVTRLVAGRVTLVPEVTKA